MQMLPAGESPAAYCSDMEQIQGKRLQQDVNLLLNAPSPSAAAADNLFTFMAMRLQQSFMNLNCGNFGQQNDVSFSSDGNGVVVAACFVRQFAPSRADRVTRWPASGNAPRPWARRRAARALLRPRRPPSRRRATQGPPTCAIITATGGGDGHD